MARFVTKTVVGNIESKGVALFEEDIPVKVLDEMLNTQADVIEPEIARNADSMLHGEYWTGGTQKALVRKAPGYWRGKRGNGQRQIALTFNGIRVDDHHKAKNRTRNAEIAFVNEYGARTTPPRPFIQKAIEDNENEAYESAEKVFRDWQEKKG